MEFVWYSDDSTPTGRMNARHQTITTFRAYLPDQAGKEHVDSTCTLRSEATAKTSPKQGIVKSVINYDLLYFPKNSVVDRSLG